MDASCASECVARDVDTTPTMGPRIPAGDEAPGESVPEATGGTQV